MTKQEIGALLALATANFPSMQEKDMRPTANLWSEMLSDIPFDIAKAALIKVLATARFWPTVAEIREAAASIVNPGILTPAEAWGRVIKAVQEFDITARAREWQHWTNSAESSQSFRLPENP